MTSYDSDSSGDDDTDYQETTVLLGYASKEATDDTVSQLGGYPTWLGPKAPPSGSFAKCKSCNDLMTLLLQLNADMPDHFPGDERRLYLFSCRRRTCSRKEGSVRALRGIRRTAAERKGSGTPKGERYTESKAAPPPNTERGIGDSLFGTTSSSTSSHGSVNPFSTSANSNTYSNPFSSTTSSLPPMSSLAAKSPQPPSAQDLPATFAQKAKISIQPPSPAGPVAPHESWPPKGAFPRAYPSYHLDAEYESLSAAPEPAIPTSTVDVDAGSSTNTGSGGGKEDKELFESTIDRTFQRFADRLAQNPLQVLRYEFRGTPLLYSKTDAVGRMMASRHGDEEVKVTTMSARGSGMPNCANCGGERVFELQLTPQAIAELEQDETGLEGMEWGTIVIGVCSRDCQAHGVGNAEVGYVEEWVGVQWEEVVGRR